MKRLIIVRHAKSSWKNENLEDYDRPLTEKGIVKAKLVARHLSKRLSEVDAIYSSTANRALHTAIIFADSLEVDHSRIILSKRLYAMYKREFFDFMKELDDQQKTIIVFTHNPLVTSLAVDLGGIEIDNVPTAGVIDIQFDLDSWSEINSEGNLLNYITPKAIIKSSI